MMSPVCQRWRGRRASFRPTGELFDSRSFDVAPIESDRVARAFVEEHHYSGTYPAARRRIGLFEHGGLDHNVELGCFVLLDGVRANGETWFLARCFELLRHDGFAGIVSFADPEPRTRADGSFVFPGHVGTIYQAANAVYVGRATPRTLRVLPDGTVFSARAASKIRRRERGWRYAVEQLVAHGAPAPSGDLGLWLAAVLPGVTRAQRHGGNHKYLFGLHWTTRRDLPRSRPYPKVDPRARGSPQRDRARQAGGGSIPACAGQPWRAYPGECCAAACDRQPFDCGKSKK